MDKYQIVYISISVYLLYQLYIHKFLGKKQLKKI